MKIIISTKTPAVLQTAIFQKTKDEELETWELIKVNNGLRLTHTPAQFYKMALLKFDILDKEDKLVVTIRWFTNQEPTNEVKGIYLGRFVEALLNHFLDEFDHIIIVKD